MFFVVDIPNSGQDVLEIMVNKPNRERQKLMREQNILKQVSLPDDLSGHHFQAFRCDEGLFPALNAIFSAAAMTVSLDVDLQAAAGPLHRQWGRSHAETGGAGRPASRPLQTHLPTVLPRFASLSAGLP